MELCWQSNSPSNEYSTLISFRMDWLDLFAVQPVSKTGIYLEPHKIILIDFNLFLVMSEIIEYLVVPQGYYCKP